MESHQALQTLAKNDVMNVTMEGLILSALVARGILTNGEASLLIREAISRAPEGSALTPAYQALLSEF